MVFRLCLKKIVSLPFKGVYWVVYRWKSLTLSHLNIAGGEGEWGSGELRLASWWLWKTHDGYTVVHYYWFLYFLCWEIFIIKSFKKSSEECECHWEYGQTLPFLNVGSLKLHTENAIWVHLSRFKLYFLFDSGIRVLEISPTVICRSLCRRW